jgi:cytochrome c-type biogenesis protein
VSGFVTEGIQAWWAPALAFAAGLVSFASPCVLPLVPGYVSFISGTQEAGGRRRPILPTVLFVLGFAVVFTSLGVGAGIGGGAVARFLRSSAALRVAGVIVIVVGAFMVLYALRLGRPGLFAEQRPFLSKVKPGTAGALPLGMAFAAGWTPCIGPVLGLILTLAANEGSALRGGFLLFVYSLGLGLPFLLVGLGVNRMVRALGFVKRNYHWIAGVGGGLMVTIGILLVTGLWQRVILPLQRLTQSFEPPI